MQRKFRREAHMNDAKDILSLLKIPSDKISDFCCESCDGETKIYIELKDIKGVCPYCGSRKIEIKDYYKVKINNSIIKHERILVEINVRRYRCRICNHSFKQEYCCTLESRVVTANGRDHDLRDVCILLTDSSRV